MNLEFDPTDEIPATEKINQEESIIDNVSILKQLSLLLREIQHSDEIDFQLIEEDLYQIKDKMIKYDSFMKQYKKWYREFVTSISPLISDNPSIIDILSDILIFIFQTNISITIFLTDLMKIDSHCCLLSIKLFECCLSQRPVVQFDDFIYHIFQFLRKMREFRPICLSIIRKYLLSSPFLFDSLKLSKNQNLPLLFIMIEDDPMSILNGLSICKSLIEEPISKFPENTYDYFIFNLLFVLNNLIHETIISDKTILSISEISVKLKSLEFLYWMEPNDQLFQWLESLFHLSQRYIDQNLFNENSASEIISIINNLIRFWLLPPTLLKVQNTKEFIEWRENFVSLCMSLFLHKSSKQKIIISAIMKKEKASELTFYDYLGQFFSSMPNCKALLKPIKHCIKNNHSLNFGFSVLISILASVYENREYAIDIKPYKHHDVHNLARIKEFYTGIPLEPPTAPEHFFLTDAHSRLLTAFSNTYLQTGTIFVDDKLIDTLSYFYVRSLVNLTVDDTSSYRLSRLIESILSIPFESIVLKIYNLPITQIIQSLSFNFLNETIFDEKAERLFAHLFSVHNDNIDISLLNDLEVRFSDLKSYSNAFRIIRSAFQYSSNETHKNLLRIVTPIFQQSLASQLFLNEVVRTLEIMSNHKYAPKSEYMSVNAIEYAKAIVEVVHQLLGQFVDALPDEEIELSRKILRVLTNLLKMPQINLGVFSYYEDSFFTDIVNDYFTVLFNKNGMVFFCRDIGFVEAFVCFFETYMDAELQNEFFFSSFLEIPITILDLDVINHSLLKKLSSSLLKLANSDHPLPNLLPSLLKYKITNDMQSTNPIDSPELDTLIITLCRKQFDVFLMAINEHESRLSEESNELLEYICSELASDEFGFSPEFIIDFNHCLNVTGSLIITNLMNDDEPNLEEE